MRDGGVITCPLSKLLGSARRGVVRRRRRRARLKFQSLGMGFRIVIAEPEHASDIAQVHVASWRATYRGIVADETLAKLDIEARTEQWENRLVRPEPGTCTFIAIDELSRAVGFATGGPIRSRELNSDGELYAIYLDQQWHRKGIGRALFSAVAGYLDEAEFTSIAVWVWN